MYTKVEKFRVILKNETPDYINASFVKVCDMIPLYMAKFLSGKTFMKWLLAEKMFAVACM